MEQSERDLLIELNTKLDLSLTSQAEQNAHLHERLGVMDTKVSAAHKRIDGLTLTGILSLLGIIVTGLGMIVTIVIRTAVR